MSIGNTPEATGSNDGGRHATRADVVASMMLANLAANNADPAGYEARERENERLRASIGTNVPGAPVPAEWLQGQPVTTDAPAPQAPVA